jgi:molybdopterin/thiamine biosynthesis adenylyltransferase
MTITTAIITITTENTTMADRYERQQELLGPEGQALLNQKRILIVGCGGLGGFLLEYMARLGVGEITAVDGDVFDASNLNHQLLSSEALLGHSKAAAAAERARQINSQITVIPVDAFFTEENADALVSGQDLVLDALDNVAARLLLEDACARHNVPLVHGAIEGWMAQIGVIRPGSGTLRNLYGSAEIGRSSKASLPFTPAMCAAIQAAEALKLLLGQPAELDSKLMMVNLLTMDTEILSF